MKGMNGTADEVLCGLYCGLSWEAASQNELPAAPDERVDPLKTVPFLSLLLVKSASTCRDTPRSSRAESESKSESRREVVVPAVCAYGAREEEV